MMKEFRPKISVIVPVYNVEKSIRQCIDSILAQTFTDFELLLIDDGSTDKSGIICDDYGNLDKRVRVFHKKNGGVSSARNLGLDNAIGQYICFCDSDDYVDALYLSTYLSSQCADLMIQGYVSVSNSGNQVIKMNKAIEKKSAVNHLISALSYSKNVGYLWCRCFKRNIIEKNNIRFDEAFKIQEDEEFIWHYMIFCGNYEIIPSAYYFYRVPNFKYKYSKIDNRSIILCNLKILKYRLKIQDGHIEAFALSIYVNRIVNSFLMIFQSNSVRSTDIHYLKFFFKTLEQVIDRSSFSLRNRLFLKLFRNPKRNIKYFLFAKVLLIIK